jgi:aspartyl-tRNA(Asn)/glutamyl-tRNA(Gln) amidotransferase subunit B
MRSKEDAQDYRYFPDPDLLPLVLTEEFVAEIKLTLPELPEEKKQRYMRQYNLSKYDASVLVADQETANYFENLLQHQVDAKLAANWITAELFARLNKGNQSITQTLITPFMLAKLLKLISTEVISGKIAKQVFDIMFERGEDPEDIVNTHSLKQVTDVKELEHMVREILSKNQDKVIEYKAGKDKLFGFFVGQIMKQSAGKANPEIINNILLQELKK